jgi:hypothetical protein
MAPLRTVFLTIPQKPEPACGQHKLCSFPPVLFTGKIGRHDQLAKSLHLRRLPYSTRRQNRYNRHVLVRPGRQKRASADARRASTVERNHGRSEITEVGQGFFVSSVRSVVLRFTQTVARQSDQRTVTKSLWLSRTWARFSRDRISGSEEGPTRSFGPWLNAVSFSTD